MKKLDDHIKEAFTNLGFTENEVKNGCWLLERGGKKIAWIAYHKFLERVAQKAGIVFEEPRIMECESKSRMIALFVKGKLKDKEAWSIGETSPASTKNNYPWAMAEKRAKDRVILKLLGVAGDMYSEEEADEFKEDAPRANKSAVDGIKKKIDSIKSAEELKSRLEETKKTDKWQKLSQEDQDDVTYYYDDRYTALSKGQ